VIGLFLKGKPLTNDMLSSLLPHKEAQFKEKKNWPIEIAQKQECKDTTHMERFFQEVMDKGGEGIILRDPNAPYQPGRSLGYLKHKVDIYLYLA